MIGVGRGPTASRRRMRASEREAWIALSLVPGIGPAGFAHLVRRHGSAAAAWDAGPTGLADIGPLGEEATTGFADLRRADARTIARRMADRTHAAGGRVVTGLDEDYPLALRTLDPRPPTLYIAGDAAAFAERAVGIVGTRRASGYGLATARISPQSSLRRDRSSSRAWRWGSMVRRTAPPSPPERGPWRSCPRR